MSSRHTHSKRAPCALSCSSCKCRSRLHHCQLRAYASARARAARSPLLGKVNCSGRCVRFIFFRGHATTNACIWAGPRNRSRSLYSLERSFVPPRSPPSLREAGTRGGDHIESYVKKHVATIVDSCGSDPRPSSHSSLSTSPCSRPASCRRTDPTRNEAT